MSHTHPRPPPHESDPNRPTDGLDRFLAVVLTFAAVIALWVVVSLIFGLSSPPDDLLPPSDSDDPLDDSSRSAPALALRPPH